MLLKRVSFFFVKINYRNGKNFLVKVRKIKLCHHEQPFPSAIVKLVKMLVLGTG